jgi:hypothetical protein
MLSGRLTQGAGATCSKLLWWLTVVQICDEQAAELRRAEEQLAAVQSALAARSTQVCAMVPNPYLGGTDQPPAPGVIATC